MLELGVSTEWLGYLEPWLDPLEIDGKGMLVLKGVPMELLAERILRRIPSLDASEHVVDPSGCTVCGRTFAPTQLDEAIRHQLGEREIELFLRIHTASDMLLFDIAHAAYRRHPDRWTWLPAQLRDRWIPGRGLEP